MADHASYLRLSQFLELQAHWRGARDTRELCHRICRTASLLLDTPSVAIGLAFPGTPYAVLAGEGRWSPAEPRSTAGDTLIRTALGTGTPQLRSKGSESFGAFPFRTASVTGCVQICIPRGLFRSDEITFLRFLASLCATVIGGHLKEPTGTRTPAPGSDAAPPAPDSPARRYVAMAVHDLRNPLNVVSGYADLLSEQNLGALTAEQNEAVQAISRQCQALLATVDQLIELDRLTSGASELAVSRFRVRALFDEVRSSCFPRCNGSIRWPGAEAAFDFESDRRRIFSIVQNLVDNALKHASGSEVVVDCTRTAGNLVIDVRDTGPGLDAELRAKIVAQAQTGTEVAPRTGLGLYAVASYIHALGGTLNVECSPAKGTNFRVAIPSYRGALVVSTPAAAQGSTVES